MGHTGLFLAAWSGCANGPVGCDGKAVEGVEELLGLANEEAIGGEAGDCSDGADCSFGNGTNCGAERQILADECGGDGEDQAGLE